VHSHEIHHTTHKIDVDECIECGFCAAICPKGAISERSDFAYVIGHNCINCSLCLKKCPVQAISGPMKSGKQAA